MAPRRRAQAQTATSDEEGVGGMDIQAKVQRLRNKLQKSFGVHRAEILAQYRTDAEDVQARTREKINGLGQRIKVTRRTQLGQLAELIRRRDAKMVAIAQKLNALKADVGAFATVLGAEGRRLHDEVAAPPPPRAAAAVASSGSGQPGTDRPARARAEKD